MLNTKTLLNKLSETKKKYYDNEFKLRANNVKATWKLIDMVQQKTPNKGSTQVTIKSLSINGVKATDPNVIVNHLNSYFTNIGSHLASAIPASTIPPTDFLPPSINSTIVLLPTDSTEIENIINNLENKASCGPDEIPVSILKAAVKHISLPLSLIINHSLSNTTFPDALKIAKVIPLYKSGNHQDPANYRPISLLNTVSKIYENIIYKRLTNFLDKHKS